MISERDRQRVRDYIANGLSWQEVEALIPGIDLNQIEHPNEEIGDHRSRHPLLASLPARPAAQDRGCGGHATRSSGGHLAQDVVQDLMPEYLDTVIKTIEAADKAARAANSVSDLMLGAIGRGGPRWHRWRALRLRLRAVRLERAGRKGKAAALRIRAALHLDHVAGHADEIAVLRTGVEPLTTG